ncbi:MAG: tetratricopeptide repeat protein [Candidatus Aminicenantales bacterium]|jgi:tetratricopeptide (TPR) repeat protein
MRPNRYIIAILVILVLAGCASAAAQKKKPAKNSDKDPQYQFEKGVIALRYGLTDEAIRYGNLAVSLDPKHYGGHSLLGNAYYKKGDFADAAAAFEKALELRPELAEAHFNLGLVSFDTGTLEKAESEFKQALAIKEDANTAYYLARVNLGQKKLDQALDEVQKSLKLDPRAPGAYNLKGVVLNQLGRYAEAAGSFQAGLVLAPDDLNLQINLGIAHINNNEPDKARPVLEKALPRIQDPALKTQIESYLKSIKPPDGGA